MKKFLIINLFFSSLLLVWCYNDAIKPEINNQNQEKSGSTNNDLWIYKNKITDNNLISISNNDMIKIFKLFKEWKRWIDWETAKIWDTKVSSNDNMNLYYILYEIKESNYFWKIYFVLNWYKRWSENLRKQYTDILTYFKNKWIWKFSNEWNKLALEHLNFYEKNKFAYCELLNNKDLFLKLEEDLSKSKKECDISKITDPYNWYNIWLRINETMNIRNSIAEWMNTDVRITN